MKIQPINPTNYAFKGAINVKNFKTGKTANFVTDDKTDLEIFKYFKLMMRDVFFSFNCQEHVNTLASIAKQAVDKGLEYPTCMNFMGEYASKVVRNNGKEEAVNYIDVPGYFKFEHKAPYVDINSWPKES